MFGSLSVSDYFVQGIQAEYLVFLQQWLNLKGVPTPSLEHFKTELKSKVTKWGKTKGGVLSGNRVDEAETIQKNVAAAKAMEAVVVQLEKFQYEAAPINGNTFVSSLDLARSAGLAIPGLCQAQRAHALAILENRGQNHEAAAERMCFDTLAEFLGEEDAMVMIKQFLKRHATDCLRGADHRRSEYQEVVASLLPYASMYKKALFDNSGKDNADMIQLRDFMGHVANVLQPGKAKTKAALELSIEVVQKSEDFRCFRVFDSGLTLLKRARAMVKKVEQMQIDVEAFKTFINTLIDTHSSTRWSTSTLIEINGKDGLTTTFQVAVRTIVAWRQRFDADRELMEACASACFAILELDQMDMERSLVSHALRVRSVEVCAAYMEAYTKLAAVFATITSGLHTVHKRLDVGVTNAQCACISNEARAAVAKFDEVASRRAAGEEEFFASYSGASARCIEEDNSAWLTLRDYLENLSTMVGGFITLRCKSRDKAQTSEEYLATMKVFRRSAPAELASNLGTIAPSIPVITRLVIEPCTAQVDTFLTAVRVGLQAQSTAQWHEMSSKMVGKAVEYGVAWRSAAHVVGRDGQLLLTFALPYTFRALPPGASGLQQLETLERECGDICGEWKAMVEPATLAGVKEKNDVSMELKMTDFRCVALVVSQYLNKCGFEPTVDTTSTWLEQVSEPMCKVLLSHKAWAEAAESAVIAQDQKMPDDFNGCVRTWARLPNCLADAGAFRRDLEFHFMKQLVQAGATQIADIETIFKVVEPGGDFLEVLAHRPSSRSLEVRLFSEHADQPDCIDIVNKARNNLRAYQGILKRVLDMVVLEACLAQ